MIEARQTIQEVMRAEAVKFSGFAFNVSAKVSATQKRAPEDARKWLILKIGARGFEPPTSRSQTERTTRLCYAPKLFETPLKVARHSSKLKVKR